jgi:hypothetical protein
LETGKIEGGTRYKIDPGAAHPELVLGVLLTLECPAKLALDPHDHQLHPDPHRVGVLLTSLLESIS